MLHMNSDYRCVIKFKLMNFFAAGIFITVAMVLWACSTTPKEKDQPTILESAQITKMYFQNNMPGLKSQMDQSAGYVVYPNITQYGLLIGGSKFGRGVVYNGDHEQIGWASINTPSLGLQAGVQGFKLLVIFQDEATLQKFEKDKLAGSASGVLVGGSEGGSSTAPFVEGVAVYQGANEGLMAGINIGLDIMQYKPLEK